MAPEHELDPTTLGDHFDRLYRAAWALTGSRQDAEDLVQETYVRVLARPRIVRGDDDIGYLVRVLRNTFVSQRRAAARRPVKATPPPEELEVADPAPGLQPEAAVEAREVYAAIAALPDEFRDTLVAVDVAGLSYAEAARALRVREGTVTSRLYRARARVVRQLQGATAPR
jgi:RNA polymerase sigma-70 factor (ECF subfamily)